METNMIKDFEKIYQMLEDEESKDIYINKLNWNITKDETYLRNLWKYVHYEEQTRKMSCFIATLPPEKPFILYGAGGDAKRMRSYFEEDERFLGFCDVNKEKQKDGYYGWPVISPEELVLKKGVTIIISSRIYYAEIRDYLVRNGVEATAIYNLGDGIFDVIEGQYFEPDFISYEPEEVFIDAGSYDLSSPMNMKKYMKNAVLKKIYAFEPDKKCYEKCLENKALFKEEIIELFPYGTWSEKTTVHFFSNDSGGSRVTEHGTDSVEVVTIDETINPADKVTFIKMDVEGSELESLKGARNIIQKDKPKLAICIYHKPEDLLEIPLYIKALVPEYKLYIRHHNWDELETVLYAVL